MVNELRCLGIPICSCNEGYFYSTNASDIWDTINHLAGRANKIIAAHEGMEKSLPRDTEIYEKPIN